MNNVNTSKQGLQGMAVPIFEFCCIRSFGNSNAADAVLYFYFLPRDATQSAVMPQVRAGNFEGKV